MKGSAVPTHLRYPNLNKSAYRPVQARNSTVYAAISPVAHSCVKLIFVRHGSAILFSEFGEKPVTAGDVIVLAANTLCGSEPEGSITVTTLYLDRDYVIDQFFWQYAALLTDRVDAQDFADELYAEPAQILRLGEDRVRTLTPWLDELVGFGLDDSPPEQFWRMQALLFSVLDVVTPYVRTTTVRRSSTQRKATGRNLARREEFAPLRAEARRADALLRTSIARRWTLEALAAEVHLSRSRMFTVFVEAYGKTPLAHLNMLRAEAMARLLRDSDMTIEAASKQVGWCSRSHAAKVFRRNVGVSPSRYRGRVLNGV
ncbi:MAG: helix-turn-helix domain-containing protein [Galactobacter sp.]